MAKNKNRLPQARETESLVDEEKLPVHSELDPLNVKHAEDVAWNQEEDEEHLPPEDESSKDIDISEIKQEFPKSIIAVVEKDFFDVLNDNINSFQHVSKVFKRGDLICDRNLILLLIEKEAPIEIYEKYESNGATEGRY